MDITVNDRIERAKARVQRVGDRLASRGLAGIVLIGLAVGGVVGGVPGAALAGLAGMR